MDEEELFGGEVNETVRVGDTVRRKTGPWADIGHRLLAHLVSPGTIIDDVGYALWFGVPFRPDDELAVIGFDDVPDRLGRARALLEGYGFNGSADPIDMVLQAMDRAYRDIVELSEAQLYPWTRFAERGLGTRNREHREWLLETFR